MTKPAHPLTGWLAAFCVVLIWSGWVVVSRLGVVQTLTMYDMAALRYTVASVAVAPIVWRYWPRHLRWWQILVIVCGQGAPYLMFAFGGMQFAPASHAGTMMNGTLPVFVTVVGLIWLKDRPGPWRITGITVILVGCGLIGWDRASVGVAPDAWIGHLMFMAASLILAINLTGIKNWQVTPMQALAFIPTVNLALYGPIYLLFLPKAIDNAPWSEIALQGLYQGLGPSVLAVLLFTTAIRTIGPSTTAATMAFVPGLAALIAIPVLGEWPSIYAWAGLLLTTGGIGLAAGWRPFGRRQGV